jgi:hypothetical protein
MEKRKYLIEWHLFEETEPEIGIEVLVYLDHFDYKLTLTASYLGLGKWWLFKFNNRYACYIKYWCYVPEFKEVANRAAKIKMTNEGKL